MYLKSLATIIIPFFKVAKSLSSLTTNNYCNLMQDALTIFHLQIKYKSFRVSFYDLHNLRNYFSTFCGTHNSIKYMVLFTLQLSHFIK